MYKMHTEKVDRFINIHKINTHAQPVPGEKLIIPSILGPVMPLYNHYPCQGWPLS